MFRIGDFSKLCRVSVRMLRYYDENGVFFPAKIDDFTGYRYYLADQVKELEWILCLRDMGLKVQEIKDVLENPEENDIQDILKEKRNEALLAIEKEENRIMYIDSVIHEMNKEGVIMHYQVNEKAVSGFKAITIRRVLESYYHEGILWEEINSYIAKNNIMAGGQCYATYHEDGYQESGVDVEVLMELKKDATVEEPFSIRDSEEVDRVVYLLVPGPYSNIQGGFAYLGKHIEDHGLKIAGRARQIPIKGPWNEQDENCYLTELQIPVMK